MRWKNIKECVLDTISDLVGKVEKRARKPWITQEMISKMDERRKWKNVNIEEGRRKYRRLRKELKRATEKIKKEYLENTCNEMKEIHRTGHYDLMYMKKKRTSLEGYQMDSKYWHRRPQGNRIVDRRQMLKIWENYVTELYDRPNRPQTLEVEPKEGVDTDEKVQQRCLEEGLKGKLRMYLEKISLDLEEEKELGMRLG